MHFSFSGYGTALSFKDLNDEDIQSTENYVRMILPSILESALAEQNLEYTLNEKMWFFGPFASAPQHFSFPPGELKTLHALVRYVKQTVDEPNECEGLHHFANAAVISKKGLSYEDNMVQSVFGLIFGCLREKKQGKLNDELHEKSNDLFKKACVIFQQCELEQEVVPKRQFTLESVTVTFSQQKWKGRVKCIFCDENDLSGDISVFFKLPGCWVLANLVKHIDKMHTLSNTKENIPKKGCFRTIKLQVEHIKNTEPDDKSDEVIVLNETVANSTVAARIETETETETIPSLSIEDDIYGQLSTQCIKMANCTSVNSDKVQTKSVGSAASKSTRIIKFCKMAGNGDCFFLSIAHQLFNVKAGSKEHEDKAFELRTSVVTYIKQTENFPNFLHDLKNRVQYGKKPTENEVTEICSKFVDDHLSKSGTWAGMESIRAICEIENVNLVVINEDGTGYLPNHFNSQAKKSLVLLFGSQNKKQCENNSNRSHYDSVVSIHKQKISEIAQQINETENHHDKFVKEAADRSAISID